MTIVIGIIFLAILIIGHEFGHFFAAKAFKLRVDEFGFGFPPRIFKKKMGETTYSFNLLPFGGFVKIHGEHGDGDDIEDPKRSFTHQTALKKAIIIVAGVFMNFLIGWIALAIVFSMGIPNRVVISDIFPNSPAQEAGLEVGQILEGFTSTDEFIGFVNANKGKEISLNNLSVIPREEPPEGEGSLGVTIIDAGLEKQGILSSISSGFISAVGTTWLIATSFAGFIGNILGGNFEAVGQVAGPVGIFSMLDEVSKLGVAPLIQFLALISLNLVVINMIPFPALDGGRFIAIIIEKIIGKRINYKFEVVANAVGLSLLLLLMVLVTIKDIANIL